MSNFKHNGIVNVDQIAEMLKLSSWDELDECNLDYYWEGSKHASDDIDAEIEALDPRFQWREIEAMEEVAEELRHAAENSLRAELYQDWHRAVMHAAEKLFDCHHLQLVPKRKGEKTPYEYRVLPVEGKTWHDAATQVVLTINGVGYFHYNSVADMVRSGPFKSAREATLNHIHWIKDYPEVYGCTSAKRLYEMQWR